MQLHKLLGCTGFLMLILGTCSMDSELLIAPVTMMVTGLLLIIQYESGERKKPR